MTDLTPTLDQLLTVKSSKSIGHTAFSFDRVDDFLKEAYQIVRQGFAISVAS